MSLSNVALTPPHIITEEQIGQMCKRFSTSPPAE